MNEYCLKSTRIYTTEKYANSVLKDFLIYFGYVHIICK